MKAAVEQKPPCSVDAQVVRCTPVCREHVQIQMVLPAFPRSDPGQFVQLCCRAAHTDEATLSNHPSDGFPSVHDADFSDQLPFLRRPFSIADRSSTHEGFVHLCVISRTVGAGTRWLEQRVAGDVLNLIGPLGQGFRIPGAQQPVVLVGGGVGIPPLLYLARRLHELGRTNVSAVFGATTRDLLPLRLIRQPARDGKLTTCVEWPVVTDIPTVITSDDGSIGLPGIVTDGLRCWQAQRPAASVPAVICACGPERMLKAVAQLTRAWGLDCQLCIERRMGCGVGTCLSCVVRQRDERSQSGWRWALACSDGPVFPRDDLLDYRD